jgi:hypothetical protein
LSSVFTQTTQEEYEVAAQLNDKATSAKTVSVPRDVFVHLFLDHSRLLRECSVQGVTIQKYTGLKIQQEDRHEAGDGIGRGVRTRVEDNLSEWETAALAKEGKRLGYVEKPAPNENMRRMRLMNVIRARRKKE